MAKKLESRTSLTEFAPLSPESKSRTFSIRNIFFRNKEKSTSSEIKTPEAQRERPEDAVISDDLYMSSDSPYSVEKRMALSGAERRGMSGILGKIMDNIVDKKKKGLQNYKDSDFKQYWMLDSNCKECYDCGDKFTTFRRRHHCRVCGQIFCWRCCNQEIPGDLIGYTEVVFLLVHLSEGRFDLSTFRSERRNEASTLTIRPKRSSLRDVGTSSYRYHTATYPPASVSANRRTNDTVFVASM
ncbi:1-phosphatidylinositol 3-phosphate 5-kinase [Trichonephila clavipes]|nr:1-phosphatidylinositol 3-phosphate 5-kinase [Trichonephila clavipes]